MPLVHSNFAASLKKGMKKIELNIKLKMKKLITILLCIGVSHLSAQTILTGKVKDDKGQPVPMAMLKVENQSMGAKADANGQYKITFPAAGTYTLIVSYIGFEKETVQVAVAENQTTEKNITLKSGNKKIKEVKVKGEKTKSSETATLAEQKNSVAAIEVIGSQEMSRKGASDAQGAVMKMAGISKEEGSSQIFVRGLGDRYNSTMLNGMFLPSDNPEYKNISLEYFPIEVIQNIGVSKTYNSNLLGDFGGATINIATKDFSGKPFLSGSIKAGLNTQSISNKNLGSGLSLLGNVENAEIPTTVNAQFIERAWNPEERTLPLINSEVSVNGGWSHSFNTKVKLSLFGTATMSNKYQYFTGMTKIVDAQANLRDSASKESYTYSVNQNAMLNLVLRTSEKFKTKINYLGFRTAANQWNDYYGYDGSSTLPTYRRRNVKDISTLHILQWINEYKHNDRISFSLNASYSDIQNDQPDRLTQTYNYFGGNWLINTNQDGNMSSYYQNLHDNDYSINALSKIVLQKDKKTELEKTTLSLGYTLRLKQREFTQYEYIFKSVVPNPSGYVLPNQIDEYFNATNLSSGAYRIYGENNLGGKINPNVYDGQLTVNSPNLNIDHKFTEKLDISFGARLDIINQLVNWNIVSTTPVKGNVSFDDFKILPFVNMRYKLTEEQNLKFAFSKTYTLPQFKELAPFLYYDISTFNTRGNPFLYTSDNYNIDLKWEMFPTKSELISVAGFGKIIQNPINKIFEAATGQTQMTYANSGDMAFVTGIEIEVKKNLIDQFKGDTTRLQYQLIGGFNVSALYSHQDLNTNKVVAETKRNGTSYTTPVFSFPTATLQGASPLVCNLDLTYRLKFKKYEPQFTLTANYFHDRLYAIGAQTAGNAYEKGFVTLDLITRHTLSKKVNMSFNIRNILNPSIERYQEFQNYDLVINQFKRGIDFSAGVNYTF